MEICNYCKKPISSIEPKNQDDWGKPVCLDCFDSEFWDEETDYEDEYGSKVGG